MMSLLTQHPVNGQATSNGNVNGYNELASAIAEGDSDDDKDGDGVAEAGPAGGSLESEGLRMREVLIRPSRKEKKEKKAKEEERGRRCQ